MHGAGWGGGRDEINRGSVTSEANTRSDGGEQRVAEQGARRDFPE